VGFHDHVIDVAEAIHRYLEAQGYFEAHVVFHFDAGYHALDRRRAGDLDNTIGFWIDFEDDNYIGRFSWVSYGISPIERGH